MARNDSTTSDLTLTPRDWLDQLKIAIINRDPQNLSQIAERDFPHFQTREELEEAQILLSQAEETMKQLASDVQLSMQNLKKIKQFETHNHNVYQHLDDLN